MPPGRGKVELRTSMPKEFAAYLQKEASYRRINLSTLVLAAIDRYLHPEQQERSALRDELEAVTLQLATLKPQLKALEATAARSQALGRELEQLRADVRQSSQAVEHRLEALTDSRRQIRRNRLILGGCTAICGAVLLYFFAPSMVLGVMVLLLAVVMLLLP
jgi:septal ring factor EnvC (AmiA/AmiB activator)